MNLCRMFSALSLTDLPCSLQQISSLKDCMLILFDFLPTPKPRSVIETLRNKPAEETPANPKWIWLLFFQRQTSIPFDAGGASRGSGLLSAPAVGAGDQERTSVCFKRVPGGFLSPCEVTSKSTAGCWSCGAADGLAPRASSTTFLPVFLSPVLESNMSFIYCTIKGPTCGNGPLVGWSEDATRQDPVSSRPQGPFLDSHLVAFPSSQRTSPPAPSSPLLPWEFGQEVCAVQG